MIRYGKSSLVSGFLAPNVANELEAIKSVKKSLLECKKNGGGRLGELDMEHIDEFLTSLKNHGKTVTKEWGADTTTVEQIVRVVEITKPILSGYWLIDIESGLNICNIT